MRNIHLIVPRKRNPTTGLWLPSQYRVLSADEWAEEHPHQCGTSIPQNANGSLSEPFLKTRTSIPQNATYSGKENSEEEKRYDTASQMSAPLVAAQLAFNTFCKDMASKDAFDLLLWILYRCSRSKQSHGQVPQSVDYYLKARRNFQDGLGRDEFESCTMLDSAADRFRKFTGRDIKAKYADLWGWLNETYGRVTEEAASAAA